MKELIVSNCEKEFVLKAAAEGIRLDGRNIDEWRKFKICFGTDCGSCYVSLGNTKVAAAVSCRVVQPKQTRPNEGLLFVNVELGTMGAPNFEPNRQSELSVYLNRSLEKCLKESRCIDLESLCIVSEEKVWNLRVDVRVLNHAGNLIECASIAALSALAHFKRPDVTVDGEDVVIHSPAERDPIPTVVHHHPICVTFGIFPDGTMISDPNLSEEIVCSSGGAAFVVGMNAFREICLLDLTGAAVASRTDLIYGATAKAFDRVKEIVETMKRTLAEDASSREKGEKAGFVGAFSEDGSLSHRADNLFIKLKRFTFDNEESAGVEENASDDEDSDEGRMVIVVEDDVASLVPETVADSGKSIWAKMENDPDDPPNERDDDDVEFVKEITEDDRIVDKMKLSDSEEEDVVVLESKKSKPNR